MIKTPDTVYKQNTISGATATTRIDVTAGRLDVATSNFGLKKKWLWDWWRTRGVRGMFQIVIGARRVFKVERRESIFGITMHRSPP